MFVAHCDPGPEGRSPIGNVKYAFSMTYYALQSGMRLASRQQVHVVFGFYVSKEI